MSAFSGLNPSFLRFPGGNNLEGDDPPYYLKWNETIGPLKDRTGYPGTWGYTNTNGLGLIEYLQWCDDLGMEPVLAVWGGFYLSGPAIPEAELQPYIDDALNELEFIMGDVSTTHGALRASLGYPEPWTIKYVEVGNEDNLSGGGVSYQAYRFQAFKDAITAKYPGIFVFASTSDYNFAETEDVGEDYHQYARPDRFASEFGYFDHWATGFKTMIGKLDFCAFLGMRCGSGTLTRSRRVCHSARQPSPRRPRGLGCTKDPLPSMDWYRIRSGLPAWSREECR
jgi:alpha-N-arabinofuranosidase